MLERGRVARDKMNRKIDIPRSTASKISNLLLLLLVSLNFVAENHLFFEGESYELSEHSEKKKDKKEKKLILISVDLLHLSSNIDVAMINQDRSDITVLGICLDIQTPPPRA